MATELGRNWEREDLGGGRFRHTQYIRRIAYFENGAWRRNVDNFVDGDASFPHVIRNSSMMVWTAGDGMRRISPTRDPQRYFEIGAPYIKPATTWQQVNLGTPTRLGNKLMWQTAQANLRATFGGHLFKIDIELKGGWQPPNGQFAFPVGLNGLTRQGANLLQDGQVVAKFNRPYVYDGDNPGDVRDIAWDFVQVGGQWYVLFTLPSLVGISRPIVDPTVTLQPGSEGFDTIIRDELPNENGGNFTWTSVGDQNNTISTAYRGCLKFDLSSIPASATISNADLSLYEHEADNNSGLGSWATALRRLLRDWVETEITWNIWSTGNSWTTAGASSDGNDRAASDSASITLDGTPANAFVTWSSTNIDDDIQKFVDGTYSNYGWLLQAPSAESLGAPYAYNNFRTSDYATASERPKLEVTYTLPIPRHGFVNFQTPGVA